MTSTLSANTDRRDMTFSFENSSWGRTLVVARLRQAQGIAPTVRSAGM